MTASNSQNFTNNQYSETTDETASWRAALKNLITDPAELFAKLELPPRLLPAHLSVATPFALRVPRSFVARMQKGDPNDPLLRQILPVADELLAAPGYTHDPLNERAVSPVPGLLHKFKGRVLILVAGGCAVNCRYCFRRHFPYADNVLTGKRLAAILDYIAADSSIHEVIYSGGDPLLARDTTLAALTRNVAAIPHIQRLRVHTRLPVVVPERVTETLLEALTHTHLTPVMVLHCNHANEIDAQVAQAASRLRAAKIMVLNQSVLLKGVNDTVESLTALSEALFVAGILPYYLNVLDQVQGAAHFAVTTEVAKNLIQELLLRLPGYLVPKLVREQAGAGTKLPV